MPGLQSLQVRDLIALKVIVAQTMSSRASTSDPVEMVAHAFQCADAFVAQSTGRWAEQARADNRSERRERMNHKRPPNTDGK